MNGDYYVTGYYTETTNGKICPFVGRIAGSTGNLVWARRVSASFESAYGSDIIYNNGYLYAVGYASDATSDQRAYVLKMDINGNVVWLKSYGASATSEGLVTINAYSPTEMYISGVSVDNADWQKREAYIFKINNNGTLLENRYLKLTTSDGSYQHMVSGAYAKRNGNDIYLVGQCFIGTDGVNPLFIFKTNSTYSTQSLKTYTTYGGYTGFEMHRGFDIKNNKIVVSGSIPKFSGDGGIMTNYYDLNGDFSYGGRLKLNVPSSGVTQAVATNGRVYHISKISGQDKKFYFTYSNNQGRTLACDSTHGAEPSSDKYVFVSKTVTTVTYSLTNYVVGVVTAGGYVSTNLLCYNTLSAAREGKEETDELNTTIENASSLLTIYPNPFSDNLTVYNLSSGSTIQVIDITGRTIFTKTSVASIENISLSNLSTGVYLLRVVTNDQKVTTQRIIKQ